MWSCVEKHALGWRTAGTAGRTEAAVTTSKVLLMKVFLLTKFYKMCSGSLLSAAKKGE